MNMLLKKITSIAFLVLGCIPVLLVLFFDLKQAVIHERMKQKLEQQQLQKIIIADNKVKWINDHEAWIGDQLFDVHDLTLKNHTYFLNGLFDDEETGLLHQKEENDETNNEETQLLENLLDWIQSPCHIKNYQLFFTVASAKEYANFHTCPVNELARKVPTPPPQDALHIPARTN